MNNIIVLSIVLCLCLVYSCVDDTPVEEPEDRVRITDAGGAISKTSADAPCDYIIHVGVPIFPLNLPDSFKEANLQVIVTYEYTGDYHTCVYDNGVTVDSARHQVVEIIDIRRY